MSNYTEVHGIIEVPKYVSWDLASKLNEKALQELPENDEWPYLFKSMFSTTPLEYSYEYQLIHFAASMKGIEESWLVWVNKFESLLSKMSWIAATVHLNTEHFGNYTFVWASKTEGFGIPVSHWSYEENHPHEIKFS